MVASRGVRLASVSVDLDEIPHYFAIHGLEPPRGPEASLVGVAANVLGLWLLWLWKSRRDTVALSPKDQRSQ